jgi:hypothetical protein
MAGDSVRVDPMGLVSYGEKLVQAVQSAQGSLTDPLVGISQNTNAAFGTSAGLAGPFDEGITAMQVVYRNLHDFQAFLTDVATGLSAIDSAANAMAVVYATTDGDQAAQLNAVDFAFADNTLTPDGFPRIGVSTLFDEQQAAIAASGQNTTAAYAAGDPTFLRYATATTPVAGGTVYTFADGSRLQVVTTYSTSAYLGDTTTTTSVFRPNETKAATVTTKRLQTDYSGQATTTTGSATLGTDGTYTSSSQSTTMLNNGDVPVSTTTDDGSGPTTAPPVTVHPQAPDQSTADLGAIQDYESQYHTHGSPENMQYGTN